MLLVCEIPHNNVCWFVRLELRICLCNCLKAAADDCRTFSKTQNHQFVSMRNKLVVNRSYGSIAFAFFRVCSCVASGGGATNQGRRFDTPHVGMSWEQNSAAETVGARTNVVTLSRRHVNWTSLRKKLLFLTGAICFNLCCW